jgi:hypothetical protein
MQEECVLHTYILNIKKSDIEESMRTLLIRFLIPVLFVFSGIACNRQGDILLTYNDGSIKRGEFYEWLSANRYDVKTITKSREQQKAKLQMLAFEKISHDLARTSGFTNREDIKVISTLTEKRIISQDYLDHKIFPASTLSESIVLTDSLFFRKQDIHVKGKTNDKLSQAISDIAKGTSFTDLTKKYVDGVWVVKGSASVSRSYPQKEYADAALLLKKGEFTKNPVSTKTGSYIIFARDIKELLKIQFHQNNPTTFLIRQ